MSEKILVTLPNFSEPAKSALEALGDVTYQVPTQAELEEVIGEYTVLVVGLGLNFHEATLKKATNLKVLATATTGLDHIDVELAETKGIKVLSLKNETEFLNTITGTAELAFGLMIDLLRKTPWATKAVTEKGEWQRENYRGVSLYNKKLGIIGLGRLGRIMAAGATGFRMPVLFTDPNVEQSEHPDYRKVDLSELLREADIVAVHVHLTEETENLISTNELKLMKNSAILINTARGKIVDEEALLKALESGEIAGYGTDVLSEELEYKDNVSKDALVSHAKENQNVLITPHIGGMTSDSREATDVFIANKVAGFC